MLWAVTNRVGPGFDGVRLLGQTRVGLVVFLPLANRWPAQAIDQI
jgi:hypothetical protein